MPAADRILILAPHMDDEVIGCGGLAILAAQRGSQVTCVFMTDGAAGCVGEARARHRDLRMAESEKAAAHLGISRLRVLDEHDGELRASAEVICRVAQVWSEVNPDLVLVPWPWDAHHDHRQAFAVAAAVRAKLECSCALLCYQIRTPFPVDDIALVLDISQVLPSKRRALASFVSQSAFAIDLLSHLQRCQGFLLGPAASSVEVFARVSPTELKAALSVGAGLPAVHRYFEAGRRAINCCSRRALNLESFE